MANDMEGIVLAMQAISEDMKQRKRPDHQGVQTGDIECPACKEGRLRYTKSGPRAFRAYCSSGTCIKMMG